MARIVLDASALLAMMQSEPGGDRVERLLLDPEQTVLVSTLNWSEVFDRMLRSGIPEQAVEKLLGRLDLETVDFDQEMAKAAALLRIIVPALSLADRACLALASSRKAAAWTTDKSWSRASVSAKVVVLR